MERPFGIRFYIFHLTPLFFVILTDWVYIAISGRWDVIGFLIVPEIAFYLGPLMLLIIFLRIRLSSLLRKIHPDNSALNLLRGLPLIITVLIASTGMINSLYNFYLQTVVDSTPLVTYPWHIFLSSVCGYVLLPSFLAWVFSSLWTTKFRIYLQKSKGIVLPSGKTKVWMQMVLVYIFVILIPFLNFVVDVSAWMLNPEIFQSIFYTDILALSLAVMLTIIIFTRKITKPITYLEQAMDKVVLEGNLNVSVPVLDSGETGRLTVRFNRMLEGLRDREVLQNTFGRYLTPGLAKEVLARGGIMKPESRVVTTLFTDIENYTTLSEKLPPKEVVELLNAYFSGIIAIINRHNGMVNKFIGDAVMALFNAPLDDPDHGLNAVRAGMEIDRFCQETLFAGRRLHTRIGINTGTVVAGNIGSEDRVEYTVIGDSVNVAQRLESHNKAIGTTILVGASTRELCGDRLEFTSRGEITVKGRLEPVEIFTL